MKVKAIITKPVSTDAGKYGAFKNLQWEAVIEGILAGKNNNTLMVKGSEFIRIGADPEMVNPELLYLWGSFEMV